MIQIPKEEGALILGALDSLGVALSEHGHLWTEGERAIYEQAVTILEERDSTQESLGCSE